MALFDELDDPQLTGHRSSNATLFDKIATSITHTEGGGYSSRSSSFFTKSLRDTLPNPFSPEADSAMLRYAETRWSHNFKSKWSNPWDALENLNPEKARTMRKETFAAYMAHYSVAAESLLDSSFVSGDEERLPAPHTPEARARVELVARKKGPSHREHEQDMYVRKYVEQVERVKADLKPSAAHEKEKAKASRESSPVHKEETSSSQGLKE